MTERRDPTDPELAMFREPSDGADAAPADVSPSGGSDVPSAPADPPPARAPAPPGAAAPPVVRARPLRVIAIGGAKGGVGKTILATNLALYLATIGRRVVIVDADASGANVHTALGVDRPARPLTAAQLGGETPWAGVVETPVPGLRLLDPGLDEATSDAVRTLRRGRMLERLRGLDADYVVVDLGASIGHTVVDFYLGADLSAYVTLPEPTAIENTYRFFRAAFARRARSRVTDPDERRRLGNVLRELGGLPAPIDLSRHLEDKGDPLAPIVRRILDAFHPRVVLNQTRVRADLELGDFMRTAVRRRLGIAIDYLGHIDFDDTVWSCARSRRPLLVESPGTKASKSIEKIARRLLAADGGKGRPTYARNVPAESHHDLLEVDRGATDEEIRRAFKRAKEIYASDAVCCYGLFAPSEMAALAVRLEEAYDVLLDPARRRPYEISVFPEEVDAAAERTEPSDAGDPRPPSPEITPETDFTGALLRQVRESQGVDLGDIVKRTKIGLTYLRAIEDEDYAALPALVYVRGFVTELAKSLHLDSAQVSRTFIRRYRRYIDERQKA